MHEFPFLASYFFKIGNLPFECDPDIFRFIVTYVSYLVVVMSDGGVPTPMPRVTSSSEKQSKLTFVFYMLVGFTLFLS